VSTPGKYAAPQLKVTMRLAGGAVWVHAAVARSNSEETLFGLKAATPEEALKLVGDAWDQVAQMTRGSQ
jgi:hypothetical protein